MIIVVVIATIVTTTSTKCGGRDQKEPGSREEHGDHNAQDEQVARVACEATSLLRLRTLVLEVANEPDPTAEESQDEQQLYRIFLLFQCSLVGSSSSGIVIVHVIVGC